jgi:dolichol-phosphate mannosyltransferase
LSSAYFSHPSAIVDARDVGAGTRVWAFTHVMEGAVIGPDCNIGSHCYIESGVRLGSGVTVKNGVMLWDGVDVADFAFIGPQAAFTNDRRPRSPRLPEAAARYRDRSWLERTRIERGASIGSGATVRCGVTIGAFALVGAGCVVTCDVPPHALWLGVPGRHAGYVCVCAATLALDGDAARCPECAARYERTGTGLRRRVRSDSVQTPSEMQISMQDGDELQDSAGDGDVAIAAPTARVLACAVAFNEGDRIGEVLTSVPPSAAERVLLIDDGSTDDTAEVARTAGAAVVSHPRRLGVGAAIRSAIRYGRAEGFDVLVIMAGNGKDRPEEIARLTRPILESSCDIVQGSRYLPGGAPLRTPVYRRIATRFVHPLLFWIASGRRLTDTTNGFRAIRLALFDDPRIDIDQQWLDTYELEPYMLLKAIKLGYDVREVPVAKVYPRRGIRYTHMAPITDWWKILRPLFFVTLRIRR